MCRFATRCVGRRGRSSTLVVPEEGLEPTRCFHRQILSLVRLPFRHSGANRAVNLTPSGGQFKCYVPKSWAC